MNKFRWFEIKADLELGKIAKKLRSAKLSGERSFGFSARVVDGRTDRTFLRFLHRIRIRVVVVGANGVPESQELETINAIDLELFHACNRNWLRVDEPPRSLRVLLSAIESVIGLGVALTPVIAPLAVQRLALKEMDSVNLISFKGIGGSVTHQAVARFEVASKQGLDPDRLEFLRALDFKVEQSTFEVVKKMTRGQVAFAPSGLVRITGQLGPFLLTSVEAALLGSR
jgi:hypothetical protein